MQSDDFEFLVSQYVDGGLSPDARLAVEQRVAADPSARDMLTEYRRLDASLKGMPMPAISWDAFSASVSTALDEADDERAKAYRMPAWVRSIARPLAVAASVLLMAGVGVELYRVSRPAGGSVRPSPVAQRIAPPSPSEAYVALLTDSPSGPTKTEVSIGPGSVDEPISVNYSDDVVSRPSHVTVASGVVPAQDTPPISSFDMQ